MKTQKILTEEISDLTVGSLPTRPTSPVALGGRGYSSAEMKAAFDKLPLYIIERFNRLIDDIRGEDGSTIADAIKTDVAENHSLADLFADIKNGNLAAYLSVLGKSLAEHIAEIIERLNKIDGGNSL